jgi:integrase
MSGDSTQWSVEKQQRLARQLSGYWAADVWKIGACPLVKPEGLGKAYPNAAVRFEGISPSMKIELKYACWKKFTDRNWKADSDGRWFYLKPIINWLSQAAPHINSLLEKGLDEWEASLREFIAARDNMKDPRRYVSVLRVIYACVAEAYDDRDEYEKDRWDARKMGNRGAPTACNFHLSFDTIPQPWLKQAAKDYCRYAVTMYSVGHLQSILFAVKLFSDFIGRVRPIRTPAEINRPLLVEFFSFVAAKKLATVTVVNLLIDLRTFLRACAREGWGGIPDQNVIYNEDIPKVPKPQPRFIPAEVMDQLMRHLDELPLRIRRMLFILIEVGLRSAELFQLPPDCLLQDSQGAWFLRYHQFKLKKDHSVPITRELAAQIQAQQQDAVAEWGPQVQYLFPNRQGRHYTRNGLIAYLDDLAARHDVRDYAGKAWKFRLHGFRHTVGYRMANSGTRLEIIQQFFGHESIEMSRRYAHITDQTLKAEIGRFHEQTRLVDIYGRRYAFTAEADDPALQALKKHIDHRTLANGFCGIPVAAGPCPHPNKCLTCPHFRTDETFLEVHERQLSETRKFIQLGSANQWPGVVTENQSIERNLMAIITAIKVKDHEASEEHGRPATARAGSSSSGD